MLEDVEAGDSVSGDLTAGEFTAVLDWAYNNAADSALVAPASDMETTQERDAEPRQTSPCANKGLPSPSTPPTSRPPVEKAAAVASPAVVDPTPGPTVPDQVTPLPVGPELRPPQPDPARAKDEQGRQEGLRDYQKGPGVSDTAGAPQRTRSRLSRLFAFWREPKDSLSSTVTLSPEYLRRKLCFVGDAACGKTSLLVTAYKGAFPEGYVPTVLKNFVCDVQVRNETRVEVAVWDTAEGQGPGDYDRLRQLAYSGSQGIAICFAIDRPDSLNNIVIKWYSEIDRFCKGVAIFLVGCKEDLRHDPKTIGELMEISQRPVTTQDGLKIAGLINASLCLEISAKTRFGMEKFMQVMAEELQVLQAGTGKRGRRLAQTDQQRADSRHLCGPGPGFETRLLAFPAGKHCQYDPIREDGFAWILRTAQSPGGHKREDSKSLTPSKSGFFGRR